MILDILAAPLEMCQLAEQKQWPVLGRGFGGEYIEKIQHVGVDIWFRTCAC